ncbi:MAG TPA: sulfate ABC transporter permease subunit [Anaerolineales bacterium]|nr:sulfate ABC transporter permease subunit [Anaerolineales bacterium]
MTDTAATPDAVPGRLVRGNPWIRRILTGLVLGYLSLLVLLPIVSLIAGALEQGIGAIFEALLQPDVLLAFRLTILIGLFVVAVHTVFGIITAWMIVRDRFPGLDFLNDLIDLPFAVSPVVVGYMLLLLFGRNGLFAPVLAPLGIQVAFAIPGMVLATLFVTLPFMVRELIPVLEHFGTVQENAAATMGASGWQIFWRVTFPALRWGLIYGIMLTFARALGEFGAVLVIGGGIQGRTETTTLYIYRALEERQYIGAYSAALVLGLISIFMVIGSDIIRRRER